MEEVYRSDHGSVTTLFRERASSWFVSRTRIRKIRFATICRAFHLGVILSGEVYPGQEIVRVVQRVVLRGGCAAGGRIRSLFSGYFRLYPTPRKGRRLLGVKRDPHQSRTPFSHARIYTVLRTQFPDFFGMRERKRSATSSSVRSGEPGVFVIHPGETVKRKNIGAMAVNIPHAPFSASCPCSGIWHKHPSFQSSGSTPSPPIPWVYTLTGRILVSSPNSSHIREYIEFEFLGDPPHLLWDLGHSFLLLINH